MVRHKRKVGNGMDIYDEINSNFPYSWCKQEKWQILNSDAINNHVQCDNVVSKQYCWWEMKTLKLLLRPTSRQKKTITNGSHFDPKENFKNYCFRGSWRVLFQNGDYTAPSIRDLNLICLRPNEDGWSQFSRDLTHNYWMLIFARHGD